MEDLLEYKCPCCGGTMEFNSSIQNMKCPYCDSEFDVESLKAYDDELANEQPQKEMVWETEAGGEWQAGETDGMSVYTCQSCGGEVVGDNTLAASSCPYCGNQIIFKGQFAGDLKPDFVIPFKIDKKAAKEALKQHMSGKKLLPKVFKDQHHIDEIKGVYVPFWLFDADANARIRYKATKERRWSDNYYNYVETSYYSVLRAGSLSFDNVPVDGSSKMPDELMESIEPFKFEEAKEFQSAYLSGYIADRYDVTSEESVARANQRIKKSTADAFAATVTGFDSLSVENSNINLQNGRAKYALYPVWILNTSWNGQKYTFAMNGQTGKFVGDLPVDTSAYWKYFGMYAAIYSIIAFIIMFILF